MTGFYNGAPFPLDLVVFGMPGCFQYFSIASTQFVLLNGVGAGSVALFVPNNPAFLGTLFYSQYACVDLPANATGFTTSNYGRILVGN